MERLTAKRAETLRKPGRYQAGDTVYLVVAKGRTGRVNKRWVQRLHIQGKRRDISIGTYPAVTLSEARERAHDNRLTAKRGGDPSGRASTVPTFADVSAKVDQGGQWSGRTRETRRRTLARYAARLMGRPVDQIDRAAVLGPVYRDKPATGKLLRGPDVPSRPSSATGTMPGATHSMRSFPNGLMRFTPRRIRRSDSQIGVLYFGQFIK